MLEIRNLDLITLPFARSSPPFSHAFHSLRLLPPWCWRRLGVEPYACRLPWAGFAVSAGVDQEPRTLHEVSWLLISMLAATTFATFPMTTN
jgi:hypothetical protein